MTLEEEIVAKGLTAPRITPADVEAKNALVAALGEDDCEGCKI